MRTKIFNALKVSALVAVLTVGIGYAYAWTSPTATPPGNNAAAPINVSSTPQVKNGSLTVYNSPSYSWGLDVVGGLIGQAPAGGSGVYGGAYNGGTGVVGYSAGAGSHGVDASGVAFGVFANASAGTAVYGNASGGPGGDFLGSPGVRGTSSGGTGVMGSGAYGVWGDGTASGVYGYSASGSAGVTGIALSGAGVYGSGNGSDFQGAGGEWSKNGTWNNASDRNLKENFVPVDNRSILAKIASLPMTQWNYKSDKKAVHIGPIAQDFYAIFDLGDNNTSISTIDPSGVALVGVKALNEKIDAQQKEIDELKAEIQALKK